MNFLLDDSGDLSIVGGKVQFTSGKEEIAQIVKTNLKTFVGEWFLDARIGVPWFSRILRKNPNPGDIESVLASVIANSDGITSIEEFSLAYDKAERKLLVSGRFLSTDGIISFSESLP